MSSFLSIEDKSGNYKQHKVPDEVYNKFRQMEIELTRLKRFETMFKHIKADKLQDVLFISGHAGEKDEMGLPEYLSVCPAYGLDGEAIYKKHKDYSAPTW